MSLIESYPVTEDGLHPVLIKDSWQVAKLNYSDQYDIKNINCLTTHQKSDKAVSLLIGSAALIVADKEVDVEFKIVQMKRGTSYNIPKNVAYAIAMNKGSQLLIVEKPNTHQDDVSEYFLNDVQIKNIQQNVIEALKK